MPMNLPQLSEEDRTRMTIKLNSIMIALMRMQFGANANTTLALRVLVKLLEHKVRALPDPTIDDLKTYIDDALVDQQLSLMEVHGSH